MNEGRYCSPNPDQTISPGKTGADVVTENLRQICIFQQANSTVATDFGIRYWNYVNLFHTKCLGESDWHGCSQDQQRAACECSLGLAQRVTGRSARVCLLFVGSRHVMLQCACCVRP